MMKPSGTGLTSLNALKPGNFEVTPSMTIAQVRALGSPPISQITAEEGRVAAVNFIKQFIVELVLYLGQSWSDAQIVTAANDFYSRFYYWRIADLKRFILGCRMQEYGQMFGHFQPQHLFEWAQHYDEQWTATSEQIQIDKNNQFKPRRDDDYTLRDFISEL